MVSESTDKREHEPERCAGSELGGAPGSAAGEKLRPCPLCGGTAKIVGAHLNWLMSNMGVECEVCGMETRSGQFTTTRALIMFWNRRADEGKPPNHRI